MASQTRVFLIDGHASVRDALALIISDAEDLVVVGQAGSAKHALTEMAAAAAHVVLVDVELPDRDGMELLSALRALDPAANLLVFTAYDDSYRVAEALRVGARGYLLKTEQTELVINGIRSSARGESVLSASVAGAVVRAMREPTSRARGLDRLTPREIQVTRLLAAGVSIRETGARLAISPKTIETHRARIYNKLGCRSAIELTRIALRAGLIDA